MEMRDSIMQIIVNKRFSRSSCKCKLKFRFMLAAVDGTLSIMNFDARKLMMNWNRDEHEVFAIHQKGFFLMSAGCGRKQEEAGDGEVVGCYKLFVDTLIRLTHSFRGGFHSNPLRRATRRAPGMVTDTKNPSRVCFAFSHVFDSEMKLNHGSSS
jgi:hypothetical protein